VFKKFELIRFKRASDRYVVADISMVQSDGVVGARKLGDPRGPVRYESIAMVS
jgi:hypothetical protein